MGRSKQLFKDRFLAKRGARDKRCTLFNVREGKEYYALVGA